MYDDSMVKAASLIAEHTDEIDASLLQISSDLKNGNDRIEELHLPLHYSLHTLMDMKEQLELFLLLEFAKSGQPGASELVARRWKSFKGQFEADLENRGL